MIVDRYAAGIEKLTGDAPRTCPWRTLSDPFVAAVLSAARVVHGDPPQPAALLALDPPHALWQGLTHYVAVRERVRADAMRAEREAREAEAKRSRHG